MSNLPHYKTLTTTNHKDALLSTGIFVRRRSFSTFLSQEICLAKKSLQYGWNHLLSSLLFLLTPHMKATIEQNTVLIRSKLHTVRTFPLYFCISPAKSLLHVKISRDKEGDTPLVRMPMTSQEV